MTQAIMGALAMGSGIAGMFFLRFWRETGDRLFVFFAFAFFILAASRVGLVFIDPNHANRDYLYWVRFGAFGMILLAIVDKNFFQKAAR